MEGGHILRPMLIRAIAVEVEYFLAFANINPAAVRYRFLPADRAHRRVERAHRRNLHRILISARGLNSAEIAPGVAIGLWSIWSFLQRRQGGGGEEGAAMGEVGGHGDENSSRGRSIGRLTGIGGSGSV